MDAFDLKFRCTPYIQHHILYPLYFLMQMSGLQNHFNIVLYVIFPKYFLKYHVWIGNVN